MLFRPSAVLVLHGYIMNFLRLLWKTKGYTDLLLILLVVGMAHGKLTGFAEPPDQDIYKNTQSVIYSSVLGAIRDTNRTVVTLPRNRTGEYFLGYSNNMFGSHTSYIKEMSKEYYNVGQTRRKRSVLHLYNMVLCATGCNPLSYKGYGCYCGFLGSGYVVDGIDRCCKLHDWCYDTAGCPMFLEYFIPYLWKCYNHHHPLCALDHGEFGGPGSCAQRLCECDRQLAQCLKMYPCPSSKALCTSSPWRLLQNLFMN